LVRFGAQNSSRKITLRSAAGYFFMFAVCAKLVYFYASHHPVKGDLIPIQGIVRQVRLGGEERAAYLKVTSNIGTHRYSSYYGKVWPGMERIQIGDRVDLLAEKNRLNPHKPVTGNQYYLWELVHNNRRIIEYDDVRSMVTATEATINKYINIWLAMGLALWIGVTIRRRMKRAESG